MTQNNNMTMFWEDGNSLSTFIGNNFTSSLSTTTTTATTTQIHEIIKITH